ncbi:MAG TPA: universal stress protein [Smithellaceae bacterium]|jgi:nucleotide-binding universal stress UspA family protein|nr:universal stress protein [Syntrophaceae bacterium]HPL98155.1 universal stress protein [Smithellaceae bacterium]HPV49140.1 universal stress protein [Smithellaceae bacterium]
MYKKILVPLDGSKLAEYALPHVKKIMKDDLSSEVTIIRVFSVDFPEFRNLQKHQAYLELKDSAMADAKQYLADVEEKLRKEGLKVNSVLIESDRPATIITDYASDNGIEIIVMVTRGYTGLIGKAPGTGKRTMLGSVAMKILHEASVPVLLVRADYCMGKQ